MGGFHATHALRLYDGRREAAHAHHWRVKVTVAAVRLDRIEVVMDFHALERKLAAVLGAWEGRDLGRVAPFAGRDGARGINPSAERVAAWVGAQVGAGLPRGVRLAGVEVEEEPGCVAGFVPGAAGRKRKRIGG
jgi:6-pyruvoyltetrahydropterin/6-carboxytetrahydropterin synthase